MFRRPMKFFPSWSAPAQIPRVPIPEDSTVALLWMSNDATATAAQPELPTMAEQDAGWSEEFGEAQHMRTAAARGWGHIHAN